MFFSAFSCRSAPMKSRFTGCLLSLLLSFPRWRGSLRINKRGGHPRPKAARKLGQEYTPSAVRDPSCSVPPMPDRFDFVIIGAGAAGEAAAFEARRFGASVAIV